MEKNDEGQKRKTWETIIENSDDDGCIELTSEKRKNKVVHKNGRANDALENDNHNGHVDTSIGGKNREILHESRIRQGVNITGNKNIYGIKASGMI